MYKSMRKGWLPLPDLYKLHGVDQGNASRSIKALTLKDKELVGKVWHVRVKAIEKLWKVESNG